MRACSEGGSYETETTDEEGVVISAKGRLPCPFFHGHARSQLVVRTETAADAELEPRERTAAAAVARARVGALGADAGEHGRGENEGEDGLHVW